jgi:putative FmdB family regulatory protein
MPLYEYHCEECGPFSVLRKMSESSMAADCESCGGESERVISVPHFALLGKAQRIAYERNEKSTHEPLTLRRSSCGCVGTHTCKSTANGSTTNQSSTGEGRKHDTVQRGGGFQMQTKRTARPWMIGH